MEKIWAEGVFRALCMLLLCAAAAACLEERGCILSVQAQEFVSFDPASKHVFLEHTPEPRRFVVAEYKKNGAVQEVVGVPGLKYFFGASGNVLALVDAEEDFLYLHRVPQNLVKMRSERRCVCTSYSKRHLLLEECDFYEDDIGQYFAWIESGICNEVSEVLMRLKSQNRSIKRGLLRRLAEEIVSKEDSDEGDRHGRRRRRHHSRGPATDRKPEEWKLPAFLRKAPDRRARKVPDDRRTKKPEKSTKKARKAPQDRNREKRRDKTKDVRVVYIYNEPPNASDSKDGISDDCVDMMDAKDRRGLGGGEFSLTKMSNRILSEEACNILHL